MTESNLKTVQQILRENHDPQTSVASYLGIPIDQFDKEDLILLMSHVASSYERRLKEAQRSYEFLSEFSGVRT